MLLHRVALPRSPPLGGPLTVVSAHVVSAFRRTAHVVSAFRRTAHVVSAFRRTVHRSARTARRTDCLCSGVLPQRPERLKSFDYIGPYAYFLTFCTDYRHSAFVCGDRVDVVSTQISRAAADEGFAVVAYCYMPDHLHLLVNGNRPNSDCRALIKRAKQLSGFYYQRAFGRRLWQRYGYEHVLRSDEAILSVARYILENPLRANVAADVRKYPFVGSNVHSLDEILDALPWQPRWPA